jgi:hypothetical protein
MGIDIEDICLWSDGTWCYHYELVGMAHMSDDFQLIRVGTVQHTQLVLGNQ